MGFRPPIAFVSRFRYVSYTQLRAQTSCPHFTGKLLKKCFFEKKTFFVPNFDKKNNNMLLHVEWKINTFTFLRQETWTQIACDSTKEPINRFCWWVSFSIIVCSTLIEMTAPFLKTLQVRNLNRCVWHLRLPSYHDSAMFRTQNYAHRRAILTPCGSC